jgi:hypothetical protein
MQIYLCGKVVSYHYYVAIGESNTLKIRTYRAYTMLMNVNKLSVGIILFTQPRHINESSRYLGTLITLSLSNAGKVGQV